jgi:hypothetical protein
MDLYKIIAELHERRKQVEAAIMNLEALEKHDKAFTTNTPKRRGRPPKNAQKLAAKPASF